MGRVSWVIQLQRPCLSSLFLFFFFAHNTIATASVGSLHDCSARQGLMMAAAYIYIYSRGSRWRKAILLLFFFAYFFLHYSQERPILLEFVGGISSSSFYIKSLLLLASFIIIYFYPVRRFKVARIFFTPLRIKSIKFSPSIPYAFYEG